MLVHALVALLLQGCSPQLKTCEGVEASKCLSIIDICKNDRSQTFACRVSLLNEYCKLSEERLACASRNLKVTVPQCRGDKDVSAQCLLAVKQVLDNLVMSCSGPGVMPQACAWLTTNATAPDGSVIVDMEIRNITNSTSRSSGKAAPRVRSQDDEDAEITSITTTTTTPSTSAKKKRKTTTTPEPQLEEEEEDVPPTTSSSAPSSTIETRTTHEPDDPDSLRNLDDIEIPL